MHLRKRAAWNYFIIKNPWTCPVLANFSCICPLPSFLHILRLISDASLTVSPSHLLSSVCPQPLPYLSKEYGGAFHLKPTSSLTASDSKHLNPLLLKAGVTDEPGWEFQLRGRRKNKSAVKMSSVLTSWERKRRCLYDQTAGLWFTFARIYTK